MNLNNKMRVSFFITLSMTCFLYTAFIFNDSVSLSKALFMNRGSSLALYNIFMVETNEKSEYMSLRVKIHFNFNSNSKIKKINLTSNCVQSNQTHCIIQMQLCI